MGLTIDRQERVLSDDMDRFDASGHLVPGQKFVPDELENFVTGLANRG